MIFDFCLMRPKIRKCLIYTLIILAEIRVTVVFFRIPLPHYDLVGVLGAKRLDV